MCESKAVLVRDGAEETILDNVISLELRDDKVVLMALSGETKILQKMRLARIDFLKHKIYFVPEH